MSRMPLLPDSCGPTGALWKPSRHKQIIRGQEDLATFTTSLVQLACECGYREADEDVQSWVNEALSLLRTKGGKELLDWLQPQMSGLRWKKRDSLNALPGYFRSRVGLTEYRTYRDNKWQIGSGMIESTAKQLVGIRLKRPGMHWSPAGASAITKL